MARVTHAGLKTEIVRCRATVFGVLVEVVTDNIVRDGGLQIRISSWNAFPIKDKITMSSMGIEFKDMKYLDVLLPVAEVEIIPNMAEQP